MRKNIVAGNWKMNTTLQEGVALAKEIDAALAGVSTKCDVIIATPFTHLVSVVNAIDTKRIGVGAENCADRTEGAYTGEVSAKMVASTGAQYVILGHSERRAYYHETPEILKEKVLLALANGLTPIFCIGEVLEEREAGKHFDVVKAQVEESLFNLSAEDFGKIILAYEPVWAIGTGLTATPEQADEACGIIRSVVAGLYGGGGGRRPPRHGEEVARTVLLDTQPILGLRDAPQVAGAQHHGTYDGGGCTKSTAALGIGHFLFVHDCIAGREIQFVGHSILLLYK